MKLLLDTHLLLWAYDFPERLSVAASALLTDLSNELFFSSASIWEVAVKNSVGRDDFHVDSGILRRRLLENGYAELPITGAHAIEIENLPHLHKDPFDRILVAQATVEKLTLLTADRQIARYPGPIRLV